MVGTKRWAFLLPPTPHLIDMGGKHLNLNAWLSFWCFSSRGQTQLSRFSYSHWTVERGGTNSLGAVTDPGPDSYIWVHVPSLAMQVLVADIHPDKGGRGAEASAFHIPTLAYRSSTWIHIKCVWPIGTIYTTEVSKNFPNTFSLKGLKSSTTDHLETLSTHAFLFLYCLDGQAEGLCAKHCLQ